MAMRKIALLTATILSGALVVFSAIALQDNQSFTELTGAAHGPSCQFNHYDAVDPTEVHHGSTEFWACCTHLSYVLEEPAEGTIRDMGPFEGASFDALDENDERYVAPLSAMTHYLRIGNGELIPMTDFTSTLTQQDNCILRFGVEGLNLNRGDVITFYRGETEIRGISEEIGSNIAVRSHIDNLDNLDFFVQTPGDSINVHLNVYSDGTFKTWASGYDETYFQILYLVRGGVEHQIDFNLRLDVPFVHARDDLDLPKGFLKMHFLEGDQIRFVRYRWWTSWHSGGDGWSYLTTQGQLDPYLNVVTFEGDYYLGCEGVNGYNALYYDFFVLASYAKDFFLNGEAIDRELLRYEGDQVQVEIDLKEGDVVYMKRYGPSGEDIIGWMNTELDLADKTFFKSSGDYFEAKMDGTYYFASWSTLIYIELRATKWNRIINGVAAGEPFLDSNSHQYMLDVVTLKAWDHLSYRDNKWNVINASNIAESFRWNGSYERNYVYDVFMIEAETGDLIARRDCTVTINFKHYDTSVQSLVVIMDRTWSLEVDGVAVATTKTMGQNTNLVFNDIDLTAGSKVRIYDDFNSASFGYTDIHMDVGNGISHFAKADDGRMLVVDTGVYSFKVDASPYAVQFKNLTVREQNDPSTDGMKVSHVTLPEQFARYWTDRVVLIELLNDDTHLRYVTGFERLFQGYGGSLGFHRHDEMNKVRIYLCAKGTVAPDLDAVSGPGYVYAYLTNSATSTESSTNNYDIRQLYNWTVRSL